MPPFDAHPPLRRYYNARLPYYLFACCPCFSNIPRNGVSLYWSVTARRYRKRGDRRNGRDGLLCYVCLLPVRSGLLLFPCCSACLPISLSAQHYAGWCALLPAAERRTVRLRGNFSPPVAAVAVGDWTSPCLRAVSSHFFLPARLSTIPHVPIPQFASGRHGLYYREPSVLHAVWYCCGQLASASPF